MAHDASPDAHRRASLAGVLDRGCATVPHQEALVDSRRRLTYRELDAIVDRVAFSLVAAGVGPGDRVAVSLPNGVDVVIAFLAVGRVSARFVGLHPGLAPAEKARLLTDADAALLITTAAGVEQLPEAPATLVVDPADEGIAALDGPPVTLASPTASTPVAIAYTSGTTGRPKAVEHDHAGVLLPAQVVLTDRMRGRGERVGVQLPLTTLNIEILGPLLAFLGAGTCVCIDTHEPVALAGWIEAERIDHLSCSPATARDLVDHRDVGRHQLAGVRLGVGGVSCPEQLRRDYRDRFGRDFTTGYGLTEAPAAVAQETEEIAHRAGASGRAMAHVCVVALDPAHRPVPPGESGEIAIGPRTDGPWAHRWRGMIGYWRQPEATAAARAGPLLLTGDQGSLDSDGYLSVADRRTDIINRGGSKISPAEVEAVLCAHPAVGDCVVLGLPDRRLGEVVVAAVEAIGEHWPTDAELQRHCRRELAGYKVPEVVAVRSRLPRNAMGKFARADIERLVGEVRERRGRPE